MKPQTLGIIANEFLPNRGGMELYAEKLATGLSEAGFQIQVFTRSDGEALPNIETHKILTANLFADIPALKKVNVDTWLSNNISYTVLAQHHSQVYSIAHGNDFLNPWVKYQFSLLEHKGIWRYRTKLEELYLKQKLRSALPKTKKIFFNSQFTQDKFYEVFKNTSITPIIQHPGVSDTFFQKKLKQPEGAPVRILTVCRLQTSNQRKNVDGVIQAVAELSKHYSLEYTIVGSGDDLPRLKALVLQHSLKNVYFKGSLSAEDLMEEYRKADIFVLTPRDSKNDVEGFGIVFLEANASGTAVLSSSTNGSREAVKDGETGFLIPDGEVSSIITGLKKLLDNPNLIKPETCIAHADSLRWSHVVQNIAKEIEHS